MLQTSQDRERARVGYRCRANVGDMFAWVRNGRTAVKYPMFVWIGWLNVDAVCPICNVSENTSFNVIKVR